jgi:hypothetical protein
MRLIVIARRNGRDARGTSRFELPSGALESCDTGESLRRHPDMLAKRAAQLARADAERGRKPFDRHGPFRECLDAGIDGARGRRRRLHTLRQRAFECSHHVVRATRGT